MSLLSSTARGAGAGAAGTTALNAVTYLDMTVRARPASETPQEAVAAVADRTGHPIPGEGEERENRLGGLGPLAGALSGVTVGALAGFCRPVLKRMPAPVAIVTIGAAAMMLTDGPLVALGLTDPKKWSRADWISDIVPHLAYGLITYAALDSTRP